MAAILGMLSSMADGTWSLICWPFRAVGALAGGKRGGGSAGQQEADAAQQATVQVDKVALATSDALRLSKAVDLVQRAALGRSKGRDITDILSQMNPVLARYVKMLSTTECQTLAATDSRLVADYITHKVPSVPGVRSFAEVEYDASPMASRGPVPAPAPQHSPAEQAVLNRLGDRLVALGRQRADAEEVVAIRP